TSWLPPWAPPRGTRSPRTPGAAGWCSPPTSTTPERSNPLARRDFVTSSTSTSRGSRSRCWVSSRTGSGSWTRTACRVREGVWRGRRARHPTSSVLPARPVAVGALVGHQVFAQVGQVLDHGVLGRVRIALVDCPHDLLVLTDGRAAALGGEVQVVHGLGL